MPPTKTRPAKGKTVKRSADQEALIQFRLSRMLHAELEKRAEEQGDSLASYVRRLVKADLESGYARAQVVPRTVLDDILARDRAFQGPWPMLLKHLRDIDPRHVAYGLLNPRTRQGDDLPVVAKQPWFQELYRDIKSQVVLIEGQPGYYTFVTTMMLYSSGVLAESKPLYLELTLRAESFTVPEAPR